MLPNFKRTFIRNDAITTTKDYKMQQKQQQFIDSPTTRFNSTPLQSKASSNSSENIVINCSSSSCCCCYTLSACRVYNKIFDFATNLFNINKCHFHFSHHYYYYCFSHCCLCNVKKLSGYRTYKDEKIFEQNHKENKNFKPFYCHYCRHVHGTTRSSYVKTKETNSKRLSHENMNFLQTVGDNKLENRYYHYYSYHQNLMKTTTTKILKKSSSALTANTDTSVIASSANLQQVLSIGRLTKGMLASSTSLTTVDANISHIGNTNSINDTVIINNVNTMTPKSFLLNTTNLSLMTYYQDIDKNLTLSMTEVLLPPTASSVILQPVIATTTTATTTSLFLTESTILDVINTSTLNASDFDTTTFASSINGTDEEINSFYFYETEQFAVLWILFIVIVLGNIAVLVTLFLNKNRKSRMNFFIKQLAIADLFVGLLNVLTDIIWRITVSWRAGNVACKLIRFLQVCVTYGSTYVLVALSIDRYDAITHPMNFSGSWQRARRLVVIAWIISAIFSSPMLFLYEEKLIQGQTQCWIELGKPWIWQLYMSLVSATLFFFPALIITACYAIIVRTIWVKGSAFIPADRDRGYQNHASRRASSRGIIPRAKVKTVKMTFVIVIVFVVCWSPYIIFDLLQVFGQIPRTQTNIAIATFIQSLAPLNSAANPLIYCLFSTQVCRALKRLPPFRWIPIGYCCCSYCCNDKHKGRNSAPIRCTTVGQRLHNSCDSMRTLTTSLTMSRRSNSNNCMRPSRVVIVERPKTILAMSEV